MSNSTKVLEMIEEIGSVSGRKDKENRMKASLDDELFRAIIVQALDPMITFGIKDLSFLDEQFDVKIGAQTLSVDDYKASNFFRLFYDLAERKLTGGAAKSAMLSIANAYDDASVKLLIKILAKDVCTDSRC